MTAAEMVYGTNLRLSGEFISPTTSTLPDASSFINQMRTYFRNIQTTKPRITQHSPHVPRPPMCSSDMTLYGNLFNLYMMVYIMLSNAQTNTIL